MKKALYILPVTALILGATVLYTSTQASAFGRGDGSFVSELAGKLGLSEDQVQTTFDELRADHHAQMLQNFEDRLDQAVEEGQITQEQKQLILEKHEEMHAKHQELKDNWQDLDKDEFRGLMQTHHQEMQQWAQDNDIDLSGIFPHGIAFKRGFGQGMRHGYHLGTNQ